MRIPRKKIISTFNFVNNLRKIKYIHYRDLHDEIDITNFQIATCVDFKSVNIDVDKNPHWMFNIIKDGNNIIYEYKSKYNSKYFITDTNDVYRLADHWGAVASCEWTLDGKGCLKTSVFITGKIELGIANLNNFTIFRRKISRRKDMVLNPEWEEMIRKIIPIRNKLFDLKNSPEFKSLSNMDKQLIGENYGFFNNELKLI